MAYRPRRASDSGKQFERTHQLGSERLRVFADRAVQAGEEVAELAPKGFYLHLRACSLYRHLQIRNNKKCENAS